MSNLDERFDTIEDIIKQPDFLQNKGLGNEVGYYVFDYEAENELYIRSRVKSLINKINSKNSTFKIKEFDLYDVMIEILTDKNYLEKCFEFESKGFDRITRAVNNLLRITDKDNLIISYIRENNPDNAIIFLTGVGKCFPILRSHTLLYNLHLVINNVPVILFYPGRYNGQSLQIFNKIKDDNYYRAFPLVSK